MKTAAQAVTILMLGARVAEGSWGRFGGFDHFGRYPTIDRDWSRSRHHVHNPQQQRWPRQTSPPKHSRDLSLHPPRMPLVPPPSTASPTPAPLPTSDPNDDFAAAFLMHAGEDVVLSSIELGELVHTATADIHPPTRRSVVQILHQWDTNNDGSLNLAEFMQMYGQLQRQMPATFRQHWANLRSSLSDRPSARGAPNSKGSPSQAPPTAKPDGTAEAVSRDGAESDAATNAGIRSRKGRLNYVDKGERIFELVFDDEDSENGDGPLTVHTLVSTRVVGDVDSWSESDVW